ncbi:PREDICTED: pentatricopeptide repeat-containing protein At5g57250, mitochondrial [Lupinus angustifolius]|nr:PREDICTED: pentatricopeptide repeat-containing protein At5g57250, mitochondrial [Lupinus angustifolius]XP_019415099.1 PREDICTED: pentatricopeptide repeat-containing protein At5g57250, mitochondrial [Lupinus angustifolius]XP_019415100.1 PREDICTED: pentatricopeptide repeat-containing protein At5g57250, mitochondrial [Lupinus angustifolius]XP_019415101.1 PREDICTED: pentatricopeptide repeat-containing protein At5g57250, mitochondrial [Lupinus angustifolius]
MLFHTKLLSRFSSSSSSSSSSQNLSLQSCFKLGITPTLKSINRFIFFLFHFHKFDFIIHFFSQFHSNKFNTSHSNFTWALLNYSHQFIPNSHTHQFPLTRIWDVFLTRLDPDTALSALRHCFSKGTVFPSPFTFSSIIQKFSYLGHMGEAIQVLELMGDDRIRYPFDDFVCSSVISGFCRIRKPELALEFFEATSSHKPGLVTYTALVGALCKLGRVDEVCDLVCAMENDGLGLDVVFYSIWVCGYIEEKVLVEVFRKMREMVDKGIVHDVISYSILIHGFSKLGDVDKSFSFLAKMIKEGLEPNKFTYTAIMSAYCKKGKVEEALGVFERLKDLGIDLDEFVFATLIDGFGRIGDFDKVFCLIGEMEKRGVRASVVVYNTIMNGLSKFGRTSEADELSKSVDADVITYSTLLHGYTEEENVPGILQIRGRLEEAGVSMDVVMCNVLMKALFMMGAFEDVHALYKRMPGMGLVPNSVTYCTMIDGYCKAGRIDEALEVFDEFRKTSIVSHACYNSIINGLGKNGMVEMATEALLELNHKGLVLDIDTCRMLMKTVFKEKGAQGVLDLVNRLEGLRPDIYDAVCNDSIYFLCKRGLVEEANQVYIMMRKKGSAVTIKSYYSILRRNLINGNMDQILPLLNSFLKQYGLVEPRVQKISACYLCLKDVDSALQFCGKTREDSLAFTFPVSMLKILIKNGKTLDAYKLVMGIEDNITLTIVDYAIVIDSLCKRGYLNEALSLCAFVEKKGITLNIVIYNSLISGLCHEGRLIEAFRLFDSLEKLNLVPSEITYATLIYAMCREGFLLDAEHVFGRMVLEGFQPKVQVYNSLLDSISKFGQLEKALELLNDMEAKYIEPDSLTISAVISCYCQKGDMEGALEFYYKFKVKDMSPDFLGFLYLIRGLCSKGRMEETRSVLREMLQSNTVAEIFNIVNDEVDTESIGDFLAVLCEQGSIQEAVTVLNEIAHTLFPVRRLSSYNQGSYEQKKIDEWKDLGPESATSPSSSFKSGLDFGSYDTTDLTNLTTNNGSYVTRPLLHSFDLYYSRIASLCSEGELQKANQLTKEMLSDMTGV